MTSEYAHTSTPSEKLKEGLPENDLARASAKLYVALHGKAAINVSPTDNKFYFWMSQTFKGLCSTVVLVNLDNKKKDKNGKREETTVYCYDLSKTKAYELENDYRYIRGADALVRKTHRMCFYYQEDKKPKIIGKTKYNFFPEISLQNDKNQIRNGDKLYFEIVEIDDYKRRQQAIFPGRYLDKNHVPDIYPYPDWPVNYKYYADFMSTKEGWIIIDTGEYVKVY